MRSHWRLGQDRVLVVEQEKWNKKSKQEKQTRKEQTRKGHPLSKNKGHQEKDTHFSKQEKDTHFQKTRKGHQNKKRTRKGHQEKDTHFPLRLNMGVPYRYGCPVPLPYRSWVSRTAPASLKCGCELWVSRTAALWVSRTAADGCPVPLPYRSWVTRTAPASQK
jgi:hypothetical protein